MLHETTGHGPEKLRWDATPDTCFAFLRALCGMPTVDLAVKDSCHEIRGNMVACFDCPIMRHHCSFAQEGQIDEISDGIVVLVSWTCSRCIICSLATPPPPLNSDSATAETIHDAT